MKKLTKTVYWTDENGNRWNAETFTKDAAKFYSKYLVEHNCFNCIDCTYCAKCSNCSCCDRCVNCVDCKDCINCTNCNGSEFCQNFVGNKLRV